jgi:hypothetical protein
VLLVESCHAHGNRKKEVAKVDGRNHVFQRGWNERLDEDFLNIMTNGFHDACVGFVHDSMDLLAFRRMLKLTLALTIQDLLCGKGNGKEENDKEDRQATFLANGFLRRKGKRRFSTSAEVVNVANVHRVWTMGMGNAGAKSGAKPSHMNFVFEKILDTSLRY